VNYDFTIFVPNIFTPNADGMNDVFIPVTRGIKFYSLMLFDRWGEKIFESSDPSLGWDGTQKGVACANDIYLWKLSVSGNNGEAKEMQGHVTLSR
jgi:gliding motility-associated-like protein